MVASTPARGRKACQYLDGAYTGSMTYTGETNSKGQPHGQGTATVADGNKYTGEWKVGKLNGHGTYTFANGDTYTGEWKKGVPVP